MTRDETINVIHKTIYQFFDGGDGEPMSDKDELLLAVNKAICNNIKALWQEPKTGHWIDEGWYAEGHSEHAYRCSECDEQYIGYVGEYKHCPNCGAKMESEEEDDDESTEYQSNP